MRPDPRKTHERGKPEHIDAIYTWVDGVDNGASRLALPNSPLAEPFRFRDNGELKYSLRSLALYAPWIETIYIVTNGQRPAWLSTLDSRIHIVHHEDIFPEIHHLPTFNSHAIESHLHRITGLGAYYLYFNDDVFLGKSVSLSDFIDPCGRMIVRTEPWGVWSLSPPFQPHDQAYRRSNQLLDRAYGYNRWRRNPAHVPHFICKSLMCEVARKWEPHFSRTSANRVRSPHDIAPIYLYNGFLVSSGVDHKELVVGAGVGVATQEYCLAENRQKHLLRIQEERPKFFVIQDAPDLGPNARGSLARFLDTLYPTPSPFELAQRP